VTIDAGLAVVLAAVMKPMVVYHLVLQDFQEWPLFRVVTIDLWDTAVAMALLESSSLQLIL
jgi:hypothetical protein